VDLEVLGAKADYGTRSAQATCKSGPLESKQ